MMDYSNVLHFKSGDEYAMLELLARKNARDFPERSLEFYVECALTFISM